MNENNKLLTDEILHNLIQDFKKKEITPNIKFLLVEELRQRMNLDTREVCDKLDIGRTSYYTWKRYHELGEENKKDLINNGWTETDIQNELKSHNASTLIKKKDIKRIDLLLEEARINLSIYVNLKDYSIETSTKIRELQNVLNRILMRVEK